MQKVQIYVQDVNGYLRKLDLFEDETIELTSTIQDVRDIAKVFTDFSQTFTVPASPLNNQIFRHYYNNSMTDTAYDSRKKRVAEIHINYKPFRKGKIYLNSVKMKLNKAHSYVLTFYGETVSLKDLIGDDELRDLTELKEYNHEYDNANVKSGFTSGLNLNSKTDSVIYPLITSKKRLFYHSDTASDSDFLDSSGNLYYSTAGAQDIRGLEYTDLKPAIKVLHIFEAIESQYNIEFTRTISAFGVPRNTFLNSTQLNNLYMWINNKKGEINDIDDDEPYLFKRKLTGYTTSGTDTLITVDGSTITVNTVVSSYGFDLSLNVSDQDVKYNIVARNLTTGAETITPKTGNITDLRVLNVIARPADTVASAATKDIEIEIQSESEITISSISLDITRTATNGSLGGNDYTISSTLNTAVEIFLDERMPKMKVLDFLTGMFKMFNLTAYYINDIGDSNNGKIYLDTLDNFYEDARYNKIGPTIDIDKYLDITSHQVESLLPFTDIDFKYEETNTVLMEHHEEQFGEVFGNAEFNVRRAYPDAIDRGKKYDIKVPFSHMKYERLLDGDDGSLTDIQWGYCAGGDFQSDLSPLDDSPAGAPLGDYDSIKIKPLLFYGIRQATSQSINWIDSGTNEAITQYWKPSNSNENGDADTPPDYTLNFDQEFDEWTLVNYELQSNSLYNLFYKKYVEGIFNPTKRMFKVNVNLPANIIVNYRLNDQIKIQDMVFRINSIKTDLTTGKSELELLSVSNENIIS
jgi:hypothetical protein